MSDHLMKNVLLVGTGNMAIEYAKVLDALQISYDVIGRSEERTENFKKVTEHFAYAGGLEHFLSNHPQVYDAAIVAVQDYLECECTELLIQYGIKKILAEKPLGLDIESLENVKAVADKNNAEVYVAYNRRFYASTLAAEKMIEEDGGVSSFHFEFTELHCESVERAENWLISNSGHVIDLAFFLGGKPIEMSSYADRVMDDRERIAFVGCDRSESRALFSYCANYRAPGRWGVEIMTPQRRLIFKPMEKLQIQHLGKFVMEEYPIDNKLDLLYKPGLYKQTEAFLSGKIQRLKTIEEQIESTKLNYKILC